MTQQMSSWTTTKEISRLTLQGFLTYHTGSLKLANRMQHQAFTSSISLSDYDRWWFIWPPRATSPMCCWPGRMCLWSPDRCAALALACFPAGQARAHLRTGHDSC